MHCHPLDGITRKTKGGNMNIIGGKIRNKICRWMVDVDNENIINSAQVSYISFEDRGPEYPKRFRLVAHSDVMDFVLYEHEDGKKVKAMFWVYFSSLNSIDIEKDKKMQDLYKEVEDEFPPPNKEEFKPPRWRPSDEMYS